MERSVGQTPSRVLGTCAAPPALLARPARQSGLGEVDPAAAHTERSRQHARSHLPFGRWAHQNARSKREMRTAQMVRRPGRRDARTESTGRRGGASGCHRRRLLRSAAPKSRRRGSSSQPTVPRVLPTIQMRARLSSPHPATRSRTRIRPFRRLQAERRRRLAVDWGSARHGTRSSRRTLERLGGGPMVGPNTATISPATL